MMARRSSVRRRGGQDAHGAGMSGAGSPAGRKLAQLCQQAEEALAYALAGSVDALLRELSVASVRPAPDASRLLVEVFATPADTVPAEEAILARLQSAHGYLRSEVAASIHRKRAPDLLFVLVSAPDPGAR